MAVTPESNLALIEELQELVGASTYEPVDGPEFSYPAVGQAVDDEMWQYITLGQGSGILDDGGGPYDLVEPRNDQNTMTLSVSSTGTAQAILNGFYHRLLDDMSLSFPMPTTETTYYVVLELNPLKSKSPEGPISVQVYPNALNTESGRTHLLLWKVTRKPNQLLTDAVVERVRPRVTPTIYVWEEDHKPGAGEVLWGSVCIVGATNTIYRSAAESENISGGDPEVRQWVSVTDPPWQDTSSSHYIAAGSNTTPPGYRVIGDRVELRGRIKRIDGTPFSPGTAYNVIPNSPAPEIGTVMNAGSDGSRQPLQVGRAAGGTLEVHVKNKTSWIDLAGVFYYLR